MAPPTVHDVHTSADGRHRWVEGAGGIYRHDHAFQAASRDVHPAVTAPDAQFIPLPMVVLRCRCGDPDSHARKGQHCPEAEIDVGESYAASVAFTPSAGAAPAP